jgi:hypothetical protein
MKYSEEVGINFRVSSLPLLFLFDLHCIETERKDQDESLEFSCILKENSSHGSAVVFFQCLTLSFGTNKVSLKGARATVACRNLSLEGCSTTNTASFNFSLPTVLSLSILHCTVAYRGGVWGVQPHPPPPKFWSFDNAEPNFQFRGKYIRNNLIRIWVSLIWKLSGTPD